MIGNVPGLQRWCDRTFPGWGLGIPIGLEHCGIPPELLSLESQKTQIKYRDMDRDRKRQIDRESNTESGLWMRGDAEAGPGKFIWQRRGEDSSLCLEVANSKPVGYTMGVWSTVRAPPSPIGPSPPYPVGQIQWFH